MKKLITILLILITTPCYAGTTFTQIGQSITYLNVDKINQDEKKRSDDAILYASSSLEFYKFAVDKMLRRMEDPDSFYMYFSMFAEQIKRDNRYDIVSKQDLNEIRESMKLKDFGKTKVLLENTLNNLSASSAVGAVVFCYSEELK